MSLNYSVSSIYSASLNYSVSLRKAILFPLGCFIMLMVGHALCLYTIFTFHIRCRVKFFVYIGTMHAVSVKFGARPCIRSVIELAQLVEVLRLELLSRDGMVRMLPVQNSTIICV
ncbi:hypothetical protein HELRODRAFT_169004 [Helobdella robusta]|uniref:Uncharacterized protein n=1 Tax=Helobdella robusta TaxID=6412 RepID=T1F190_HELRO|nr:hypothetical protein HELRODRAFT_169004 [Helobdella robusta]ESO09067.1 hypothetical protein HELRODRAFT_169004 [Helobdella robusta]